MNICLGGKKPHFQVIAPLTFSNFWYGVILLLLPIHNQSKNFVTSIHMQHEFQTNALSIQVT